MPSDPAFTDPLLCLLILAVAGISAAAGYGFRGMVHRELQALIDHYNQFREFMIRCHNDLVEALQKDNTAARTKVKAVIDRMREAL